MVSVIRRVGVARDHIKHLEFHYYSIGSTESKCENNAHLICLNSSNCEASGSPAGECLERRPWDALRGDQAPARWRWSSKAALKLTGHRRCCSCHGCSCSVLETKRKEGWGVLNEAKNICSWKFCGWREGANLVGATKGCDWIRSSWDLIPYPNWQRLKWFSVKSS